MFSVSGVSSFAFQGTNAHGLVGASVSSTPKSIVAVGPSELIARVFLTERQSGAPCSPLFLTQCLGVNNLSGGSGGIQTTVILADLSSPRSVIVAEDHSILGHRVFLLASLL